MLLVKYESRFGPGPTSDSNLVVTEFQQVDNQLWPWFVVRHNDIHAAPSYDPVMAVPNWSPVLADDRSRPAAQAEPRARHLDRENAALRELVTVYRYLSGLALQDADLAGVVRLISDRTAATVAVLTQLMDVLTAAAPGVSAEKAAADVREHMVHPRLGQVLRASRLSQRALRLPKVGGMPAIIVAPVLVGDEVPSYLSHHRPAGEPLRRGHEPAGDRTRRHHLRGHPRPRARGGRGRPPRPRRPGGGPAARPRPGQRRREPLGRAPRLRPGPRPQRAGDRVRLAAF